MSLKGNSVQISLGFDVFKSSQLTVNKNILCFDIK